MYSMYSKIKSVPFSIPVSNSNSSNLSIYLWILSTFKYYTALTS